MRRRTSHFRLQRDDHVRAASRDGFPDALFAIFSFGLWIGFIVLLFWGNHA